jgi:RNA polymerase sigma-70 factor (ECF subfamily)
MGERRRVRLDDEMIVRLYWNRNENAISESSRKYGAYCTAIAQNILQNRSDAEECVNDTWLRAWNAMPPHMPSVLSVFLGKITRNLSFDRFRKLHREKRGGGSFDVVLDELAECVSGSDDTERRWEETELKEEIDRFLSRLPKEQRKGAADAALRAMLRAGKAGAPERRSAYSALLRGAAPKEDPAALGRRIIEQRNANYRK